MEKSSLKKHRDRHSFVLRLWREEGNSGWRGWVQHARSGDSAFIGELEELLSFVEHRAGKLSDAVPKKLK